MSAAERRQIRANLKTVNLEIDIVKLKLKRLKADRRKMLDELKLLPIPAPKEALMVVPTSEVKTLIQIWIDEGSTLKSLAAEAACSERTITSIMALETKYTNEIIADGIRQAVGMPHYELTFLPNQTKPPQSQYYEN